MVADGDGSRATVVPLTRLGRGAGRGQPVAFIHGLLGSNAIWRTAGVDALVAEHDAVALPLPAHHPWHLSPDELAQLLQGDRLAEAYAGTLRKTFDGRPVRLVGHSTGALVALEIARLHPELVAGVLIVGALRNGRQLGCRSLTRELACLPVLGAPAFRLMLRAWLATPRSFHAGLRSAMAPARVSGTAVAGEAAEGRAADAMPLSVMQDLRQSDPGSLHALAQWLRAWRGLAAPERVGPPVLSVICARDPVVHPTQQLALVRGLRRVRSVVLASGHLPMVEQPAAFCDVLGRWLAAPRIRFDALAGRPGSAGTARRGAELAV